MPVTQGQGNPDWSRDETILVLDLVQRHWPKIPGKNSREVQALSELIRRLPIHAGAEKNERFRNPAGVYLKLQNLTSLHPDKSRRKGLRTSITDRAVWREYAESPAQVRLLAEEIAKGIAVLAAENSDADDEHPFEASEGMVLARVHRLRERKRGFRNRLLKRAERAHGGIACEACGSQAPVPPPAGYAMFEVHHLVPLARAASTVTRLDDLALLCASCHRLIHEAMRTTGEHCTVEQFRAWLRKTALT